MIIIFRCKKVFIEINKLNIILRKLKYSIIFLYEFSLEKS